MSDVPRPQGSLSLELYLSVARYPGSDLGHLKVNKRFGDPAARNAYSLPSQDTRP